MIFENLSDKLQNALSKLTNRGKLTEKDIDVAMREVKLALLEADVNYKVVKDFISQVKERAIDSSVLESLTPGQQVIKIVNEELTKMMGEKEEKLNVSPMKPTVIMLCGLQGAGKTTHAGKLALNLKNKNKSVLLVACDIYRPAAIKQLQVVGGKVGVEVFEMGQINPVEISKKAIEEAKRKNIDYVIIDTAGRLHIDDTLMDELKNIKQEVNPSDILLVVDAMTGQDAVNVAAKFNEDLDITGIILTKLDGDARGGAALSIRQVADKPIKFIGVGEKLGDLEPFHPDRMASRILGMGDVLSLIEKAQNQFDEKKAKELEEKIKAQSFDFNDFLDQMQQIKKMGPMQDILAMIPGVDSKMLKQVNFDNKEFDKIEAIIKSMTKQERENPDIISISRRKRIAKGCGQDQVAVNKLLKQFKEMKVMMKNMGALQKKFGKKGKMKMPFFR
ncbi:signal recognition particle protein [Finegoldia magna]|uniref:Signal recognition particle protein n=4 Tax=Finegoldia magna TaxID=1260 RepID=B0S043_FINM2|nr:signal recognition particle protein [Finegoldia magna]EFK93284.1 signal recognition particle protein [Finegoldia magna ACS-171-V-Col3]EFL53850.1 signal recognition particle protein [Finegoldia magna BVS033A4]EGS34014.1 signal recognition particle protein [Finegoldia magna SY403409CC001050417]EXF27180.1 signal recognition particle [Finegoldia magna ALB8]MDU4731480.1 signal recognition particle protein [Finegoldia magna]